MNYPLKSGMNSQRTHFDPLHAYIGDEVDGNNHDADVSLPRGHLSLLAH